MKIVMLRTERGSVDGVRIASYEAGQEYDLTATAGARDLAKAFIGAELAREVGAKPTLAADPEPADVDASQVPAPEADAVAATAKAGRKPKVQ